MNKKLLSTVAAIALLSFPNVTFSQAPNMGTADEFVLFTSNGALTNTGLSQLTGHVGSNSGSSTNFGNVNGVMNNNNGASAQASADLLIAYNQLNATVPTFFPAPLLGNGQSLNAGVYSIAGNATLNSTLILNGQGNANAVFIIQIQGAFASAANAMVTLTNNAQACNVFWKIEGAVNLASGTIMRGTIIANNAAITLNTGVTLEGRALSTAGAVSVDGVFAYTPVGCGSPFLVGPSAPALNSAACFALFTSNGPATNAGTSKIVGDVGTNVGLTTGYVALDVTGAIHPIPDGVTAACATDLLSAHNFLNNLPYDIELLYPPQFGNKLVLTPHTYLLDGATMLNDTLFLNAQGNANATFVIRINGALSTSSYAIVSLINGAQAVNVYWDINGAVNIGNYAEMKGTFIANNGAMSLTTGVKMAGRALSTNGALSTSAVTVTMPPGCGVTPPAPTIITQPVSKAVCVGSSVNLKIAATGTGLTYQWRKGIVNLANGGNISGATSAVLNINPVGLSDAASDYNVIVSGATAPSATSAATSLTVNTCSTTAIGSSSEVNSNISVYPNPFSGSINIIMNDALPFKTLELRIYNALGVEVMNSTINKKVTTLETANLSSGVYFYKMIGNNKTVQSGRLISQ